MKTNKQIGRGMLSCALLAGVIFTLTLYAMGQGTIERSMAEIFRGLFLQYDKQVATIYHLRFPRILVSLLAGGGLAVSGLLFQATLRNPLADPGIIGISGGAAFVATLISGLFPTLYFSIPLFACLGGIGAYFLIYTLAWRGSLDPVRILLVGVAVSAVFSGLTEIFAGMANRTGISLSVSGLTQLVWDDVRVLAIYTAVGLSGALMLSPICNLMALEDATVRGLGVNVNLMRVILSAVAVVLCAGVTAVVGVIGFLALVAPHMARKIVGNDHRILIPFAALLGAMILLVADTLGRTIFTPTEISAHVLMNVLGGPFFILLLRREVSGHGN